MKFEVNVPPTLTLKPWRRYVGATLVGAAARATDKAAQGARDDIRSAMRGQRLGGLANAIGSTSDLRKKRVPSAGGRFDVAGFVYARVKSERTLGALKSYVDQDTTSIRPAGKWLAIATQEIPKKVGRRRMTPALYRSSGLEERIGPLTFIKGKHPGVAYLVARDVTISGKPGKARRLPKRGGVRGGRARVGIVAFTLIRATRRSRRVDPRSIARSWVGRLPDLIKRELASGARQGSPAL